MKYLILLSLVLFAVTEDLKCPLQIDPSVSCPSEYTPVCGYSSEGQQFATFENSCFACRSSSVAYYQVNICQQTTGQRRFSYESSSSTGTAAYPCSLPKDGSVQCQPNKEQVCGLFNSSVQCANPPCGSAFDNYCLACTTANVISYFYGECSDYVPETNLPSTENDYVPCSDPRPSSCSQPQTNTCAFTQQGCIIEQCQKSVGNACEACKDKSVVGYVLQPCASYGSNTSNSTTVHDPADDGTQNNNNNNTNGNNDNNNNNNNNTQDIGTSVDYQCSTTRPTSCDDNVNTVCANYKCDNKICEKEFKNECQACLDSTTLSYKKNLCQVSYQPLMTLAFIIQLFF